MVTANMATTRGRSWESLPGSPAAGRRIARLTGQLSYIMRTCGKTIIANL